MRTSVLAHDADPSLPPTFDKGWFEAMRLKGITPDYFIEGSAERIAYKEYLDNLQVIALGSSK